MRTIKLSLSLLLVLFNLSVFSQDIEANKRKKNEIILDSEHYKYASAVADSFDIAVRDAVGLLASQIMTDVRSETVSSNSEQYINGTISSTSYFSNVIKTFTDIRLTDYQVLMIDKPSKKSKSYEAFVYISSDKVNKIIAELKQGEMEADQEKKKQLDNYINFYYTQGLNSLETLRIGNALKFFYSGYILASGTQATINRNGEQPADLVFSQLLDETLHNISVFCEVDDEEKIGKNTTIYKKQLGFYYRTSDNVLKKLDGLDFQYNDGNTYVNGAHVRDGVSIAELRRDLKTIKLSCLYTFDANELDPIVKEALESKTIKSPSLSSADKTIECNLETIPQEIECDGEIATFEAGTDPIMSVKEQEISRFDHLTDIMYEIEDAIRNKAYNSVKPYFTENGFDCYNKLICYGNASIIKTPIRYDFIEFGDYVICRSITMQFKFKNNKQFVENVTFRFNKEDQIESLAFALTDIAQHDIMDNEDWDRESKITLLTFMEDYQTAYALKRFDYLDKIFSDDALIISGYTVMTKEKGDGIRLKKNIHLDTLSKSQYMTRLHRHFNTKEYINLNFTETEFTQTTKYKDVFGIRLRQEYYSSNYSDEGYLFLLVDLREELPIIHVRAWQEDKLPLEKLISLRHFRM